MKNYQKGDIVHGIVYDIKPYGIFVKVDECYTGLIHISEVSNYFVYNLSDYVRINERIHVKIIDVNDNAKQLKLSIKNIEYKDKIEKQKNKIKETKSGFKTLLYKLPIWIEENLKNEKIK